MSNTLFSVMTGYSMKRTFIFGILILGGFSLLYQATSFFGMTTTSLDTTYSIQLDNVASSSSHHIRLPNVTSTLIPTNASRLEKCPEKPPGLVGKIFVNMSEPPTFDAIARLYKNERSLEVGGKWRPDNCSSRSQLAVVMTYRNRTKSIKLILQHLHGFLQKQLIQYQMFIVEPPPDTEFNRGLLKNIGFVESGKRGHFQCVVFQDIDLLPENDRNLYHCPSTPRHLVVAINTSHDKPLLVRQFFGGAVLLKREHFQQINGFSNYYFGWGAEDDDLLDRIIHSHLRFERSTGAIGRYQEVKHRKDRMGKSVPEMYATRKYRFKVDGLNKLKYDVINVKLHPLFTWIYVTYNESMYKAEADEAKRAALVQMRKRSWKSP